MLAIGDRLIPGFATLRQKFKTWIVNRVKQAVAALNRIVTAVKDGIKKVMTAVGNALKQGLDLLKKGISAAINAVKNAVKAAIEKAKAMIATLAQFAVIIKDVAANPGAWIRNLGAAIMDGIKNHLWAALKQAISQWFNDKVESLLGLGKSVWNLLTKGGITMAQVGKMAWDAIKSAIPAALIAILVERLVSMIVPAAGAVMAIIQGLVAAWGAIQRILAAIDRFIAFLKAVKSGNAGPAFAQALAAAAVAVIEFVSQFLLRKIAGAASKVAGKIKAIAQKIGKRLMAAMKKVGKAVKKGWNKLKAKAKKAKEKIFGPSKKKDPKDKEKDKDDAYEKRLDSAVTAIRPQAESMLHSGTSKTKLTAKLAYWRLRYRIKSLQMTGASGQIVARAPAERTVVQSAISKSGGELHDIIRRVARDVLADVPDEQIDEIIERRKAGEGSSEENPRILGSPGAEALALGGGKKVLVDGEPMGVNDVGIRRPKGTTEWLKTSEGLTFKERQSYSSDPGHIETGTVGSYPAVVAALAKIKQQVSGVTDADVAGALAEARMGKTPELFRRFPNIPTILAETGRLHIDVETARNPSAAVSGLMNTEAVGKDRTVEEAIMKGPPAPLKGTTAGKGVNQQMGFRQLPGRSRAAATRAERAAFLAREEEVAVAWMSTLLTQGIVGTSEGEIIEFIHKRLYDYLMPKIRGHLGV